MSKKLYLTFLWHMHQPYYKDDIENRTMMPWVFLHAIKDYYEMVWYLSLFKKIKATFNLVPSLIYQLEEYSKNRANDKLLNTIKKDIHILNNEDKKLLNSYLFLSNEKNMIKPLERYYQLFLKYKKENSIYNFSYQELLDTEVLFLLSWCGNYLRENNRTIKLLLEKGENYTTIEKDILLKTLENFISKILDYYRKLEEEGRIEISTTPFYHPIIPLLIDFNSAKEARSDVKLPNLHYNLTQYASLHTKFAIKYFKEKFNKKPKGFWPAEGTVSPKTLTIFRANGIEWSATDEEILFKTLNNRNRANLYKDYSLNTKYGDISIRFRDRLLSDAIGFEYSQRDEKEAVTEFINNLRNIYNSTNKSTLVNIILDGENAWEFYKNNAKDFFIELYKELEKADFIETIKMEEIDKLPIERIELNRIATGSWINGNFDIWIGSSEKNRAWELLELTREAFLRNRHLLSNEEIIKTQKEFMIAQSSDWFWWYGDDHFTTQKEEFDFLFRKHLINIFNILKEHTPKEILTPIIKKSIKGFNIKPSDFISPKIDGKRYFFEWLNSGVVDIQKEFSAMDTKSSLISKFYYGYNKKNLYLLFYGEFEKYRDLEFIFKFDDKIVKIKIPEEGTKLFDNSMRVKMFHSKGIVEVGVDKSILSNPLRVNFSFKVIKNEDIMQFFPLYSDFFIDFEELKLKYWFV